MKKLIIVVAALIVLWIAVLFVNPGIVTIQPIGIIPEGITVIYYGREHGVPFFASPDGFCLKKTGSVSLMCRGLAITQLNVSDRIILRLSYSEWAYLQSTDGQKF